MRRYTLAIWILSVFYFVLAAPVPVGEALEVRFNAAGALKDEIVVSEKRMDSSSSPFSSSDDKSSSDNDGGSDSDSGSDGDDDDDDNNDNNDNDNDNDNGGGGETEYYTAEDGMQEERHQEKGSGINLIN
jgi:hypothetical protein